MQSRLYLCIVLTLIALCDGSSVGLSSTGFSSGFSSSRFLANKNDRHEDSIKTFYEMSGGDLIEIDRGGYFHWAVCVGDGYLVHLSGQHHGVHTVKEASYLGSAWSSSGVSKAKASRDLFWDVVGHHKATINNKYDKQHRPLEPEEVVKNALSRIGDEGYNLLMNNCEHFATFCRYGVSESDQVKYKVVPTAAGAAGAAGAAFAKFETVGKFAHKVMKMQKMHKAIQIMKAVATSPVVQYVAFTAVTICVVAGVVYVVAPMIMEAGTYLYKEYIAGKNM